MKKGVLTLFLLLVAAGMASAHCCAGTTNTLPLWSAAGGTMCCRKTRRRQPFSWTAGNIIPVNCCPPRLRTGRTAEQYVYVGRISEFLRTPRQPIRHGYLPPCAAERRGTCAALPVPAGTSVRRAGLHRRHARGEQGSIQPYKPLVMDGVYSFLAGEETEIIVQCANYTHYYSGMYYPPAVGTPGAIARLITARLLIYGLLCFSPLAVALSNLALWASGGTS
mgnify:CR=1 FL=1